MMLLVAIGASAFLLVLLLVRPAITRSVEGKILACIALLVAPAIAAYGGVSEHLDRSKTTSYCLSCHVMSDYGKSMRVDDPEFLAAVHYQNNFVPKEQACFSCHSDYGMSGNLHAKARGFKHVMKTYFGTVPDTIRIARRYRNRECLKCHVGSRLFEESPTHLGGAVAMADLKSGKTSCLKSGCHDLVHEVSELDLQLFWDPANPPVQEASAAGLMPAAGGTPAAVDSLATAHSTTPTTGQTTAPVTAPTTAPVTTQATTSPSKPAPPIGPIPPKGARTKK
jgi:nitrate/TMAO reductase-like tetraheme cytochrome c subunit